VNFIEDLKRDFLDVRIFCGRYFPFIVIPLSYARIIVSTQIPTAAVDEAGQIIINPDWWNTLTKESKRFVAIHECLHLVLCHPFRAQKFNPTTYNICADGKTNYAIAQANIDGVTFKSNELVTLHNLANLTKLSSETLQKMSTEEITNTLQQQQQQQQPYIIQPFNSNQTLDAPSGVLHSSRSGSGFGSDLVKGQFTGEIIQTGNSTVFNESYSSSVCLSSEKLLSTWRQLCSKAKAFAVQTGALPASLERLVLEVLEVKPPWQTTLRFGLRNGSVFDSSFAYPNRRNDILPGSVGYLGAVWLLVDRHPVVNCLSHIQAEASDKTY
jgi:hypothetical protein